MTYVITILLLAVLGSDLASQGRPPRALSGLGSSGTRMVGTGSHVGEPTLWWFSVSELGELTVLEPFLVPEGQVYNTLEQITSLVPGDYAALQVGGEDELLLCGRGPSGGRIEHWAKDAGTGDLVLRSSTSIPGRDFTGIAHDPNGSLYVLDAVQLEILSANWTPPAALPGSFSTWATVSDVPDLANANDRYIRFVPDAQGDEIFLGKWPERYTGGVLVSGTPGLITADPGEWWTPFVGSDVLPIGTTASEGGTSVEVLGPPLSTVHVINLRTAEIVGVGTVPAGQTRVTVNLNQTLILDDVYAGQIVGNPLDPRNSFLCVRRYGEPETLSNGMAFLHIQAPLDGVIGNADFVLSVPVTSTSPPAETELITALGVMHANFRTGGVDPLIPNPFGGPNPVLVPSNVFLVTGYMTPAGLGRLDLPLPIPNNPSLIGAVLLYQFGLEDPPIFKISEVIGFAIRDTHLF